MKTIKIIDLLNKIANGEEVPEKIKYRKKIFIYNKDNQCYIVENYNEYDDLNMSLSNHKGTDLLYEAEILEEAKKIPEKISINDNGTIGFPNGEWTARNMDKAFAMKINSIIDYLKSKEKGE